MAEPHIPVFKVSIDNGEGFQQISNQVIKWDANVAVTSRTNTASLDINYDALQQIQDFDTSARLKIEAGYDENNLKLIFDGLIRNIRKGNTDESFDVEADDYSVYMLDRFITGAFIQTKAVDIIKDIIQDQIPEYTFDENSFDDHEFIVENYAFEDKPISDVIEYLTDLIGFNFWVESDGANEIKFFCKLRKSVNSNFVLERGKNLKNLIFIEDKSQMFNRVIIEGDKREFNTEEGFLGDGSGKEFTVRFKPRNVRITIDGNQLHGGIEGAATSPDFFVDFFNRKITFVNTPANLANIIVTYSYDIPIKVEATDFASIARYGEKVQLIKNKNIKEKSEARKYAREYIKQYGKPLNIAEADAPASVDFDVGNVITVIDSNKGINSKMQVLECTYTFSKRDGFTTVLKLAQTAQTGSSVLKDIILRLKQVEELLRGDVEIVTKLSTFEETITIRIKRITAKKRELLKGFTYSREGVWNKKDWGVENLAAFETFFEFGDKDVLHTDTVIFQEEELKVEVLFSPELDKVLVWSLGEWTQDSWSGETVFAIPTPTIEKTILDELKSDLERTSFHLSVHPDFSNATLWSLNGASPPLWSKIGFTKTPVPGAPTPITQEKEAIDLLSTAERESIELTLDPQLDTKNKLWSFNYVWSETGEEIPLIEPTHIKDVTNDLLSSEHISMEFELPSFMDDELVYSRSRWSKSPTIEFTPTANIILKEIDEDIVTGETVSFRLNELEDGFFWGIRAWSTDDWGNIPKSLAQQDIQNRIVQDDLVSGEDARLEVSFESVFRGWGIKLWNQDGWVKFEQPAEQPATHDKFEEELLVVSERVGFQSINSLNQLTDFINSKSKWSEAAW